MSHPNIYTFLTHLQNATVDCMTHSERLCRGVEIRRPKKQRNILNDARIKSFIEHYDNVANSRLQFRQAISHSLHAHTEAFHAAAEADSDDEDDTSE